MTPLFSVVNHTKYMEVSPYTNRKQKYPVTNPSRHRATCVTSLSKSDMQATVFGGSKFGPSLHDNISLIHIEHRKKQEHCNSQTIGNHHFVLWGTMLGTDRLSACGDWSYTTLVRHEMKAGLLTLKVKVISPLFQNTDEEDCWMSRMFPQSKC